MNVDVRQMHTRLRQAGSRVLEDCASELTTNQEMVLTAEESEMEKPHLIP